MAQFGKYRNKREAYFFPEKKLDAFWYAPPSPQLPRIFISELREHTYFAKVRIRKDGELIEVDARPSDAIALAVTARVPIYAPLQYEGKPPQNVGRAALVVRKLHFEIDAPQRR